MWFLPLNQTFSEASLCLTGLTVYHQNSVTYMKRVSLLSPSPRHWTPNGQLSEITPGLFPQTAPLPIVLTISQSLTHLTADPEWRSKTENILFAFLPDINMSVDSVIHLPSDSQVIRALVSGHKNIVWAKLHFSKKRSSCFPFWTWVHNLGFSQSFGSISHFGHQIILALTVIKKASYFVLIGQALMLPTQWSHGLTVGCYNVIEFKRFKLFSSSFWTWVHNLGFSQSFGSISHFWHQIILALTVIKKKG